MINCNTGMDINDFNMTNRLEQIIERAKQELDISSSRELAVYLTDIGIIAAPVEIGQEVYLACPATTELDVDCVSNFKVHGITLKSDGKMYVLDGWNEEYEIGSIYCRLTYTEAESDLNTMIAERNVDLEDYANGAET